MWSTFCIAVRNFERCLKRMGLTYNVTLYFLPFGITRWCEVHFTVQWGLWQAIWKNGSQIHDNTFPSELSDFWASFLPFRISRWMWSPLCIAVRNFEGCLKRMGLTYNITLFFLPFGITRWCEFHFTAQWGFSKAVWKEWISNTLLHFSDWINRFLSFLLAFWNYKML